ncbi:dynein beta chain, flagellar outer arm, putative [Eimeria praecox]|uniref:Dynein heavy chain, cytoplasmic n=1 Tax=Eimeria praecox TaxID=51316 RepID=U6H4R2_9EIME|nr:dynein beta chain, flagellar outer arm, putative [Eimeria praecox]
MDSTVERAKVSLINFLLEVTPPLLGCSRQQLQKLLSTQAETVLKPFLVEQQPGVLVIGKEVSREAVGGKTPGEEGQSGSADFDADDEENFNLYVDLGFVARAGSRSCSVAFIKRPGFSLADEKPAEPEAEEGEEGAGRATHIVTKPIGPQLALMRCGFGEEESLLDVTEMYMQRGFGPLLKTASEEETAATAADGAADGVATDEAAARASHGMQTVNKKLRELVLAVQQAQQNVDIPLIELPIDSVIKAAVMKAAAEKRKPVVEDLGDKLQDSTYLIALQGHVNRWIKDIQKVCRMQRDPSTGTAAEEVNFWLGFERALKHVEDQLKTTEAEFTLTVLKHTRKVFATMSFEQDSGLRQATEIVQNTNILMRDFPLNDLCSAQTVEQLTQAVRTIFAHMRKLKNATLYPLSRAYFLVEALSRDLATQLLSITSRQNLISMAYEEFEHTAAGCSELFRTWDEEVRHFRETVRELSKKRGLNERPPSKLVCEHVVLQERIVEVRQFRRQHHRLKEVLNRVLGDGSGRDVAAQKDIAAAYQIIEALDVLDVSRTGEEAWEAGQKAYDMRIDRVESQITAKLRDRLGASKTSAEMFRVFSQFNALFFRPRIRGAIQEYQTKLIQVVKEDLKRLQGIFLEGYQKVESNTMAEVRDMPRVAGMIVWGKQVERRLDALVQRIQDVLGKGWEQHIEGQKLKLDIDFFRAKLNPQEHFDAWLNVVRDQKRLDTGERIFVLQDWGAGRLELTVNFDKDMLTLFKEVRLLSSLQFRVPYSVKVMADEAKVLYPFAITLQEVLRTYIDSCASIGDTILTPIDPSGSDTNTDEAAVALLVASYQRDSQGKLAEGMNLCWDSDRLETYVKRLAEIVYIFEAKTEFALQQHDKAIREIDTLKDKPVDAPSQDILAVLQNVQKLIEEQHLQNYSNIRDWTKVLESRVETILMQRLVRLVEEWTMQFEDWPNKGTALIQNGLVLEIQVKNQVLQVHPAVEAARQLWMGSLHRVMASVCLLPRFNSRNSARPLKFGGEPAAWDYEDTDDENLENGDQIKPQSRGTYRALASRIPPDVMNRAYAAIDRVMEKVEDYVANWMHYQVLWDVDVSEVLGKLGDDIETWQQLLNEIKQARSPFDNSEARIMFGPTIVDHHQVQAKLNTRYDAWHRDILHAFGQKVSANASSVFTSLHAMVVDLEEQGQTADPTDTTMNAATFLSMSEAQMSALISSQGLIGDELISNIVSNLTKFLLKLQEASKLEPKWSATIDTLRASERLLERQRFTFPSDWLWTDRIEGEMEVFSQLLRHQGLMVEQVREQLIALVTQFAASLQEKLQQLYSDWMLQRPVRDDIAPGHAMSILRKYEQQLEKITSDYECGEKAKAVLGVEATAYGPGGEAFSPSALAEEIADMKGVWQALGGLHTELAGLRETLWAAVIPKQIRSALESLLERIKQIPARFRQYEAFEELKQKINKFLSLNMLITDMKTDALKERHWKMILSKLKIRKSLTDMTIGNLWDADLAANEADIREVLVQAQGESALEEFLRQVKDSWREREFVMVPCGGKCKVIKGWEDLFQTIDDQLASIQSMKMSPFFKIFEEEALAWDEKLNRLRTLLDSWVEVQRKWLYLEGVFSGSQDIQMLLPAEHQRFRGIDAEFKGIMKKADTTKVVLEVASTEGLARQLERLSDLLSRIQKALGEYLEKQREQFSRFYFVGDEDLLEMIGNAKDVKLVQRHVSKLFAGIAALETDPEDPTTITAMTSREGEVVPFVSGVSILQYASLKDWMSAVEMQMTVSLADNVSRALRTLEQFDLAEVTTTAAAESDPLENPFVKWIKDFPLQALLLAMNIRWTKKCEAALSSDDPHQPTKSEQAEHPLESSALKDCVTLLGFLADRVVQDVGPLIRNRIVHMITEVVHQRDVCRSLVKNNVTSRKDFRWLECMRFYFNHPSPSGPIIPQGLLKVCMADATFDYGFEYLGATDEALQQHRQKHRHPGGDVLYSRRAYLRKWGMMMTSCELRICADVGMAERLVQTPLTDKCFLTLTQALKMKLGGNPFGPAGTGKTESVKALGSALGRYTLVFNCDETFDFNAMGRLFSGLCQVGAWGCFDEFNRLDERILSAVSEQILTIQIGLREGRKEIELLGKATKLNTNVGIFVTMNPGYAGRSNLPDNLKQLFREVAMIKPDKQLIAQVTLYAQGFRSAERLSSKIISLYDLCDRQLSKQPHYDFGLRSLKSALSSAGSLKRQLLQEEAGAGKVVDDLEVVEAVEQKLLIRSVTDTVVPKLVAQDVPLLRSLLMGVFPGADIPALDEKILLDEIERLCEARFLEAKGEWLEKVLQLYQIQRLQHGVMLVGPVGTGKSAAWRVLLDAMEKVDGIKGMSYVLDPKVVAKEQLYGKLDSTTLEWQDGVFTAVLRKILATTQEAGSGAPQRRHWIVFDGDVDPDWAENLNSALDDNKLLTLPNGERLEIPNCIRLLFEVETLKYATLATVSRCGIVWFASSVLPDEVVFQHHLDEIAAGSAAAEVILQGVGGQAKGIDRSGSGRAISRDFGRSGSHIMSKGSVGKLASKASMAGGGVAGGRGAAEAVAQGMKERCWMVLSILWGMGGSLSLAGRSAFSEEVARICDLPLPAALSSGDAEGQTLLDFEPSLEDGQWHPWKSRVKQMDIDTQQVKDASLVIQTVDTLRHRDVVEGWLEEKKPFILCGPPGSGKTMTLTAVLKERADFDVAFLNFSSGTTPDLLFKTFDHYCELTKTAAGGMVMRPLVPGRTLIIFCDECNLPSPDKYGTQHVIMLIRQIAESGGFWRSMPQLQQASPWVWIRVEGVQFAGACNPPTDAGRHHMSNRFLRHAPIIFVDFPGKDSLVQIYRTFNRALLRPYPGLFPSADALTMAMVDFYTSFSSTFTVDQQPHYIYSPRELTRWKLALAEALEGGTRSDSEMMRKSSSGETGWSGNEQLRGTVDNSEITLTQLVRTYAHEGLRIFSDRLVTEAEREETDKMLDTIVQTHFPSVSEAALQRPILFTSLASRQYCEVSMPALRSLLQGKLRVFNEEVFQVQLVFFDEVLHHVARIDRVLRQPLGHLLLVGASGAGKTILTKFVSWMNGLSIFQIKAGRNYNTASFEQDLRVVMKRAALKEEKIAFVIDESNALGPAFLERMNALLASGEVPGLFEGDEYTALINECKAAYGSDYLGSGESSELFARFTKQVQRNLHIIFTMNPANPDFYNRQATSPALFNRCVIDWFGDWAQPAMEQVAFEFTDSIELLPDSFTPDATVGAKPISSIRRETVDDSDEEMGADADDLARRSRLATAIVSFHHAVAKSNAILSKSGRKSNYMTPRDFLDFLHHFRGLVAEKSDASGEQQHHLQAGLQTLAQVERQVGEMRTELTEKGAVLAEKNEEAEKKMQQMINQQAEAEDKKKGAEVLARKLDEQTGIIKERRAVVEAQLSEVEPLLREAAEAVTNIPKKSLDELKSMANPPAMAKVAVEAVAVLITDAGEKAVSWEDARKILKASDFITKARLSFFTLSSRILNFDCASVSSATRRRIQTKFLTGDWDIERINKASRAAGPLAQWVESSVKFVLISEQVEPLQTEIAQLETEAQENEANLQEQQSLITQLEGKLQQYKQDYAQLISQVQSIKREMEEVQKKCARSMSLLENLGSEKNRWFEQLEQLKLATQTFIGDSLLAAAFCAYLGFFEYADRHRLLEEWRAVLQRECIRCRVDLSFVDFLSTPSERLQWAAHSLPPDDLSVQNAIILKRFLRYPLIIDPAGQAINFLTSFLSSNKLSKTSFLDANFLKALESSLRFGSTLVIQDVEKVDPILNPVLNRETHKLGGRVLITVGDSEIDLSPAFSMYLATRDPTAQFTPDICSRVTIINFTLTPSSLVNQCLNLILKSERADIDKKRSDMLKLQGEFKVKIRELEDALLLALSNVKGNILDDDSVMSSMEMLKRQAAEVAAEAAHTEEIMAEVDQTSNMYLPWALAAGRIYFTLLNLSCVSPVYQYDLRFFLGAAGLSDLKKTDYSERLSVLLSGLFSTTFKRVAYGLGYYDRLVFALQLCFIRTELDLGSPLDLPELHLLLQGFVEGQSAASPASWTTTLHGELTAEQTKALQKLLALPCFSALQDHMEAHEKEWISMLQSSAPETNFPSDVFTAEPHPHADKKIGSDGSITLGRWIELLRELLVLRALRPDRVTCVLIELCESVLGKDFLTVPELTQDLLREVVEKQASSTSPVLFVLSPGSDPSSLVTQLATAVQQPISSIAMGSKEGFELADKAIAKATRQGTWVLCKNVHLSLKWLQDLETNLHRGQAHTNFRLFLTMEYNPKVPATLVRASCTFVFEPPLGIKASLYRSYAMLFGASATRGTSSRSAAQVQPVQAPAAARCRLQFLLAFLHAIILERRRYAPVGWCKLYEFSEADQKCALSIVDSWLAAVAQRGDTVSDHVAPERIPWTAIRALIAQVCYGGRLDNAVDERVLRSFVDYLFRPEAFESDFCLNMPSFGKGGDASSSDSLRAPVELYKTHEQYLQWVDSLPSRDMPAWIGFNSRAEWLLAARQAQTCVTNWSTLLLRGKEEDLDFHSIAESILKKGLKYQKSTAAVDEAEPDEAPKASWLTLLIPVVQACLTTLPDKLPVLQRTDAMVQNPMFRCFERELAVGARLCKLIRESLGELLLVCKGELKITNSLRDLASQISSSKVPPEWGQVYVSAEELTVKEWLEDLSRRLAQLAMVSREFGAEEEDVQTEAAMHLLSRQRDNGELTQWRVWLGGLFFPSAYLTATRQAVAQAKGWSLDDLAVEVIVGSSEAKDDQCFIITGLTVEGAAWNSNKACLDVTHTLASNLPPMVMRWYHKADGCKFKQEGVTYISTPLFLNRARKDLVAFVDLPAHAEYPPSLWIQRGTAVLLWSDF